jgi:hypothetical protein
MEAKDHIQFLEDLLKRKPWKIEGNETKYAVSLAGIKVIIEYLGNILPPDVAADDVFSEHFIQPTWSVDGAQFPLSNMQGIYAYHNMTAEEVRDYFVEIAQVMILHKIKTKLRACRDVVAKIATDLPVVEVQETKSEKTIG